MTLEEIKQEVAKLEPSEKIALAEWLEMQQANGATDGVDTSRLFGWMEGTVKSYGDTISPIDERWDADE